LKEKKEKSNISEKRLVTACACRKAIPFPLLCFMRLTMMMMMTASLATYEAAAFSRLRSPIFFLEVKI
jgi:hypothetical protein